MVQLGAILVDDDGNEVRVLNKIIKPTDWTIPDEAADIHGISTERALAEGEDLKSVLEEFLNIAEPATLLVCHNMQFDIPVISQEFDRAGLDPDLENKDVYCTMVESTNVCKLPWYPGSPKYKWPKLIEAYRHFYGEDFEDAHDALADVRACKAVYAALQERTEKKFLKRA